MLDVDTGTDDAGALLFAATAPGVHLEAALATWGNCARDRAVRNTLAVLEAAGCEAPVHPGADRPIGPAAVVVGAELVMGLDGLAGASVDEPTRTAEPEPAAQALVRMAAAEPGALTLVALAPLSTLAAALELDPGLPGRLAGLVVMGGALGVGGNSTPAAEANIAHDPSAAAAVVDAFGAPDALASGEPPRLVPLDVTLASALTTAELDALSRSPRPGAGVLHRIWSAAWPTGLLETGRRGVWPAHDLLATWCATAPEVCSWEVLPLAVDTGGGVAWGATVVDRRVARIAAWADQAESQRRAHEVLGTWTSRWAVATAVDVEAFHASVRAWLAGGGGAGVGGGAAVTGAGASGAAGVR